MTFSFWVFSGFVGDSPWCNQYSGGLTRSRCHCSSDSATSHGTTAFPMSPKTKFGPRRPTHRSEGQSFSNYHAQRFRPPLRRGDTTRQMSKKGKATNNKENNPRIRFVVEFKRDECYLERNTSVSFAFNTKISFITL